MRLFYDFHFNLIYLRSGLTRDKTTAKNLCESTPHPPTVQFSGTAHIANGTVLRYRPYHQLYSDQVEQVHVNRTIVGYSTCRQLYSPRYSTCRQPYSSQVQYMSLTVQSQVQYMSSTEQFSGTANIANCTVLRYITCRKRTVLKYSTCQKYSQYRQPHSSKHFTYLQTSIVQYYGSVQTITSLFVEE